MSHTVSIPNNPTNSAIAAAIDAEKIDFQTFCTKLPDYLQSQVAKVQGDETRKQFLSELFSGVQTVLGSLVSNTGGEFGTRGESYMGIILVLSCSIIIGLHSVLEMLIRVLIRVSGSLYVAVGIAMMIAGFFELKGNASFFYLPIERNKLVTTGIYRMVRHPVYGGLLLLCIGLSITSQRWDKMVLSVVLGVVLVSCHTIIAIWGGYQWWCSSVFATTVCIYSILMSVTAESFPLLTYFLTHSLFLLALLYFFPLYPHLTPYLCLSITAYRTKWRIWRRALCSSSIHW